MSTTAALAAILITCLAIIIRWCISLNKYSGAGIQPMYGDYEAQRHWMEITYNLPVKEWYENSTRNDLQYWGLDYPPLTAYHSWLCGYVANWIQPEWVALNQSRGHESSEHKLFMRYTVLLADILVYFLPTFLYFKSQNIPDENKFRGVLLMLLYPGLILIDHGHFQYNCVSLGLVVLAVTWLAEGHNLLGSVAFCLSLNYKQMELYHALPFFSYLLGLCFRSADQNGLFRLLKIGSVVVLTFVVCWFPFLTDLKSSSQVLNRLFPFQRGLFEDKVANIWCSLSIFIKLKQILTIDRLILICLSSTLVGLLPSAVELLLRPSIEKFKISLVNSSLVFFLLSFQVHEKSILIPALSVSLLILENPLVCTWFLLISTFSMLPLLIKDGLVLPFCASMGLFFTVAKNCLPIFPDGSPVSSKARFLQLVFYASLFGSAVLTVGTLTVSPPPTLPDLFPVLISFYSCCHFILFTLYFHYLQFTYVNPKKHVKISTQDQKRKKNL